MAKMKVAQVPKAGADFEIAERESPQPKPAKPRASGPEALKVSQDLDFQSRALLTAAAV